MIKVAFTTDFPVEFLSPEVRLKNPAICSHPCSWIRVLAEQLVKSGEIDLHIITASYKLDGDQMIVRDGISYHLLSVDTPAWLKRLLGLPDSSSLWLQPLMKIHRTLRKIHPDLVHGHGTEGYFSLAAVHSGYPNVISLQGLINKIYPEDPTRSYRIVRHFETHSIRRAQYINAKTKMSESFVASVAPNAKVFFIEASINGKFWLRPLPPLARNIFFVGSLIRRKGIEEFVRGYVALKSEFTELRAYVIGNGSKGDREKYSAPAREAGVAHDLIFTGQIDHDRILELYAEGGIFCLTSHIENSPNVVMEAMAAGLPVVASDVGAVKYIVEDGVSGFLTRKGDIPGLMEAVGRIFRDGASCQSFGGKGREIASKRWKPEIITKLHLDMYYRILADRHIKGISNKNRI